MTLHKWNDYEQDRRANAREWTRHSVIALLGGLVLATIVNLMLGACQRSEETQMLVDLNAAIAQPEIPWWSSTIDLDITCEDVTVTVDIYADGNTQGMHPDGTFCYSPPQLRLYRRATQYAPCEVGANFTPWYQFDSWELVDTLHVRATFTRDLDDLPLEFFGGNYCGAYWEGSLRMVYDNNELGGCYYVGTTHCSLDEMPANCGGGHGGFEEQSDTLGVTEGHLKTCAISLGCPGQGPCVCTCAAQREPQRKQPKMDYTPPVGLWGPGAYRY